MSADSTTGPGQGPVERLPVVDRRSAPRTVGSSGRPGPLVGARTRSPRGPTGRRHRCRRRSTPTSAAHDEHRLSSASATSSAVVDPDDRRGRRGRGREVPRHDLGADLLAEPRPEPALGGSPDPQSGARCCCGFRSSPAVDTSRSRWMASWGQVQHRLVDQHQLDPAAGQAPPDPTGPRSRPSHEVRAAPRRRARPASWRAPAARHRDGAGSAGWAIGVRPDDPTVVRPGHATSDPSRTT